MQSDINEYFPFKPCVALDQYLVEVTKPLCDILYKPTQFIA